MAVSKDFPASVIRIALGYMLAQFLIYEKLSLSVEKDDFLKLYLKMRIY